MQKLQTYFENAISKNQLKIKAGQRNWRKYFLNITELVWERNLIDGCQLDIFEDKTKRNCLESITIDYQKNIIFFYEKYLPTQNSSKKCKAQYLQNYFSG